MQNGGSRKTDRIGLRSVFLLAVAVPAAYLAWHQAAVVYFSTVAPYASPRLLASSPVIQVGLVDRAIELSANSEAGDLDSGSAALRALHIRPLDPAAVRMLGGEVDLAGGRLPNSESLVLSERLSRRDRWTQLFLIARKSLAGDLGAIENLDRLLTVRPAMIRQLMPQLLQFARLDEGREILAGHSGKQWFAVLVRLATNETERPVDLARLVLDLGAIPETFETRDLGRLTGRLARDGHLDDALVMAEAGGVNLDQLAVFSPNIGNTDALFTPLTWSFESAVEGVAALGGNGVRLDVRAGGQFVAMVRVTGLAPGQYQMVFSVGEVAGRPALANWQMRCLRDDQWVVQWQSGWREPATGSETLPVELPVGCAVQRWEFIVQGPDGQGVTSFDFAVDLLRDEQGGTIDRR